VEIRRAPEAAVAVKNSVANVAVLNFFSQHAFQGAVSKVLFFIAVDLMLIKANRLRRFAPFPVKGLFSLFSTLKPKHRQKTIVTDSLSFAYASKTYKNNGCCKSTSYATENKLLEFILVYGFRKGLIFFVNSLQKDDNFRGGRLVFECGEMKRNKTIWEDGFVG
jgi:hypothetical protein